MWLSVLVVSAVVTTACGQLMIYSRQYAESLNVTCAYKNDTSNNVSYAISLVISRSTDGQDQVLASINTFNRIVNHAIDGKVIGSMNGSYNVDSNLTVYWTNASYRLIGDYSCTLYGLDENNVERVITQKLTVQLQDRDPEIRATPSHIVDGFTPSLIVECSLTDLAVYDISELLQVDISHSDNESSLLIASLNATRQSIDSANNTASLANGWEVISTYFKARSAYLAVKLPHPTTKDAGKYTCDVSTTSNSTAHILKSVNVSASVPDTIVKQTHSQESGQVSSQQYVYDRLTDRESLQDYYLFACNFEHGLCGLNLSGPSNISSWTLMPDRLRGLGLHYAGPQQDVFGHYLYLEEASLHTDIPFIIETNLIPPIRRSICISFWILVSGSIRGANMYTRQNGVLYNFYTHAGFFPGPWERVEYQLPPIDQPFTVVIEFKGSFVLTGFIAVDDITISDFNCG